MKKQKRSKPVSTVGLIPTTAKFSFKDIESKVDELNFNHQLNTMINAINPVIN
jgi:hypothetical protein